MELPGLKAQIKELLHGAVTLADTFRPLILIGIAAGLIGGLLFLTLVALFFLRPALLAKVIAKRMR